MRQLIIARKDLQMSPGKLAAQVSHASMAFVAQLIREGGLQKREPLDETTYERYEIFITMDPAVYDDWFGGIYTKTICEAKNRNQLLKAKTMAEGLGLKEGSDFFIIKDRCLTELEPEEIDENGDGWTVTAIGFRPLRDELIQQISRKYQLYR